MEYVVVGQNSSCSPPSLVLGPFESEEIAEEEMHSVAAVSKGLYVVLPIHRLNPAHA